VKTFHDTVTQLAWRLMSISVSEAFVKLLWSIHTWWASTWTVIEFTAALENAMLRTMTLWTLLMFSPCPVMRAVDPAAVRDGAAALLGRTPARGLLRRASLLPPPAPR